jgi:hypothetical protein
MSRAFVVAISVLFFGCGGQVERGAPSSCDAAKSTPSVGAKPIARVLGELDMGGYSIDLPAAVDPCGALYFAGGFYSGSAKFGSVALPPSSFVVRYDSNDQLAWAVALPIEQGPAIGFFPYAIATTSDSVIIGGSFTGTFKVPGQPPLVSISKPPTTDPGVVDLLLVRLDTQGHVVAAAHFPAEEEWVVQGLATTSDGDLMAIGSGKASIRVGDVVVGKQGDINANSAFIARFDEHLVPRWVKSFNGSSTSFVALNQLSTDPAGDFHTRATTESFDFGVGTSTQNYEYAALTFDGDGNVTELVSYPNAGILESIGDGSGRTFEIGGSESGALIEGQAVPANSVFIASHGAKEDGWVKTMDHAYLSSLVIWKGRLLVGGRTRQDEATVLGRSLGVKPHHFFTALFDEDGNFERLGTFSTLGTPLPNGDLVSVDMDRVGTTMTTQIVATQFAP